MCCVLCGGVLLDAYAAVCAVVVAAAAASCIDSYGEIVCVRWTSRERQQAGGSSQQVQIAQQAFDGDRRVLGLQSCAAVRGVRLQAAADGCPY